MVSCTDDGGDQGTGGETDLDAITWYVDFEVDLTNFGLADSTSTFTAIRTG